MKVTLTQHPVGQGGMMSGLLEIPGGSLHWVYDCGSNQRNALCKEIAKVARRGPVDLLFISHLDADHVSDVDKLLAATHVEEVVLPYLNDLDRLVAAAHDASMGLLTGGFLDMLLDIEGWFAERGVGKITFVRPRSDDDDSRTAPAMPDVGGGGGEGELKLKWSQREGPPETTTPQKRKGIDVGYVETSDLAMVVTSGPLLNWIFSPYAHRPSDKLLKKFSDKLLKSFPSNLPLQEILKLCMWDNKERKKLRICYDEIWANHNLVSMALYSGPVRAPDPWKISRLTSKHRHYWKWSSAQEIGWLLTGDAHLDVEIRRLNFLNHYGSLLDRVQVFGLPHHGSKNNFHPKLLEPMPNLSHCVAAAGPNSHGHPGEAVKIAVDAAGIGFVRVGHRQHHEFTWEHD